MKQLELTNELVTIFRAARDAAVAADPGESADGGTCNMDSPAFRIHRAKDVAIQNAAQIVGIDTYKFEWYGRRWYWLGVPLHGQANRRTTMMEAAQRVLKAVTSIPGWETCGYMQMD